MNVNQANLEELIKRMPKGYEQACFDTSAIKRKREIKSPTQLLELCLMYLVGGFSLIEISVIARSMGIKINDTAFFERFAKCYNWFAWIVSQITPKAIADYDKPKSLEDFEVIAIDASVVKEKGSAKRVFRLHYALDVFKMCAASFKITAQEVGETLTNFDLKENWLIL